MTDETFISEKTGKRYKLGLNAEIITNHREQSVITFNSYVVLREIIEPKLEVGDWIQAGGTYNICIVNTCLSLNQWTEPTEIRKASGEVWKRINGEWQRQ